MKRRSILLLLIIALLLSGCSAVQEPAVHTPPATDTGTLTVSFIDVGQADSILLSAGGEAMLIDAGNNDDGGLVLDYIASLGITELKYAVGTHPDEDHIGGLDTVMASIPVGTLLMPDKYANTKTYRDVISTADECGITLLSPSAGDTLDLGGCVLTILGPMRDYSGKNDCSIVIKAVFGDTSFLFTGDIETDAEHDLVSMGYDLTCDVLKAPHHGSSTSSSYVFLRSANPKMIVIPCGRDNSYGHPHEEVMSRYSDLGATVYRTDTMGTVVMTSDGTDITTDSAGIESPNEHIEGDGGLSQGGEISVTTYIGNLNSKKFHAESCSSLPAEHNRITFSSRAAAVDAGYSPCGTCKP